MTQKAMLFFRKYFRRQKVRDFHYRTGSDEKGVG